MPAYGVYSVEVDISWKTHFGMMNIGTNPTFDDAELKIEVHIFDFDQNIYGQEIQISIIMCLMQQWNQVTIPML